MHAPCRLTDIILAAALVVALLSLALYVPYALWHWPGADVLALHVAVYLVAAYALAGAVSGLITGAPVVAVAVLAFDMPMGSPLLVASVAVGGSLMLSLTGIVIGLWSAKWDHAAAFFAFLLIPLTFLSGLFAPVELLPAPLDQIVRLNPIFYVIDGFRAGVLGIHSAPVGLSLAVVGITIVLLWIACDRLVARGWKLKP